MYYGYGAIILWAILDVLSRLAVVSFEANPVVFTCYNMLFGGIVLALLGGRSPIQWKTFAHPLTWVFGFLRMSVSIFYTTAFIFMTTTEGSFLLRVSSVMIVALYWLSGRKKFAMADAIGMGLFLAGFLWMAARLDNGFSNLGVIFILIAALLNMCLSIVAEVHPIGDKAEGFRKRSQYTGVVLIVSSLVFIGLALASAWLNAFANVGSGLFGEAVTTLAPQMTDFVNMPTILLAVAAGFILRAPITYMYLYSVKLIKADNILLVSAVGPFAALGVESLVNVAGLLPMNTLDGWDILAGAFMTIGAIFAVFVRLWVKQESDRPKTWYEKELEEVSKLEAARKRRGEKVTKIN